MPWLCRSRRGGWFLAMGRSAREAKARAGCSWRGCSCVYVRASTLRRLFPDVYEEARRRGFTVLDAETWHRILGAEEAGVVEA